MSTNLHASPCPTTSFENRVLFCGAQDYIFAQKVTMSLLTASFVLSGRERDLLSVLLISYEKLLDPSETSDSYFYGVLGKTL
jgi:hypothetical protein